MSSLVCETICFVISSLNSPFIICFISLSFTSNTSTFWVEFVLGFAGGGGGEEASSSDLSMLSCSEEDGLLLLSREDGLLPLNEDMSRPWSGVVVLRLIPVAC